jgi:hypothetical protein
MLILMLFILLPMNFGFVENSSVEKSTDLSFYADHYENSELMMSENDALLIHNYISDCNIITSPTRNSIWYGGEYNSVFEYSNEIVTSPGNQSDYYSDGLTMFANYKSFEEWYYNLPDTMDGSNIHNSAYNNPYDNKGRDFSPYIHTRYLIPNSKVNRQVPRLYTSGFI